MTAQNLYFYVGLSLLAAACASPSQPHRGHAGDLAQIRQVAGRADAATTALPEVNAPAEQWAEPSASVTTTAAAPVDGWSLNASMRAQDPDKAMADQNPELKRLEQRVQELESRLGDGADLDAGLQDMGEEEGGVAPGEADGTGTDPRAFGTKFMPYYRYTELKNEITTNEFVLFGLVRFSDNVAATYEMPVAKRIDYADFAPFQAGGGIPSNPGVGGTPPGGVPISALEADGDNVGVGDFNFRLFVKNDALRFGSPFVEEGSSEIMPLIEVTIPTATEEILGSDSLILSPGFALVVDMPAMGFFAMMNFYDFDAWTDRSRGDVSRFRGRWFYMQPLTPPAFVAKDDPDIPDFGIFSGLYLLPELQPVYDFETDDFSFWVGPELGKVYAEGQILYVKPGWGIDQAGFDRQFTTEVGWRFFF